MCAFAHVAWETLGVPSKRRAYDSVDPEFDDDIPSNNQENKDKFFQVFAPVFERNARCGINLVNQFISVCLHTYVLFAGGQRSRRCRFWAIMNHHSKMSITSTVSGTTSTLGESSPTSTKKRKKKAKSIDNYYNNIALISYCCNVVTSR